MGFYLLKMRASSEIQRKSVATLLFSFRPLFVQKVIEKVPSHTLLK